MIEGFFIFDKLISQIKTKFSSRKKEESIDSEGEDSSIDQDKTDPRGVLDKTGITDIGNLVDEIEDGNDDEEESLGLIDKIKKRFHSDKSPSRNGKKKSSPILLVLIVIALAFFLFYDEETPSSKENVNEVKGASVNVKEVKEVKKVEAPNEEVLPVLVQEDPSPHVSPSEIEDVVEKKLDTVPDLNDISEIPVETQVDTLDNEPENFSSEIVDSPSVDLSSDESITDKILEDLEKQVKQERPRPTLKDYVSPPDYEYRGRGLVYNCVGKHWACVDGPSYKMCEDNYSTTSLKNKNIECYPFNVYETMKGCDLMQNRVVSSNAKTDFCKGEN